MSRLFRLAREIRWGCVALAVFVLVIAPFGVAYFAGGTIAILIYGAEIAVWVVWLGLLVLSVVNPPPPKPLTPEFVDRDDGADVRRWRAGDP